jgi:carboxymethylenebutenolidase
MREETVMIDSPGGLMDGYLAVPDAWPPGPGIVVVQEWWGLNDNIRDIAGRFAAAGYAAVVPDLYRGQQADEPDEARKLAMRLDQERAIDDLGAAAGWLFDGGCQRVGVCGFCMGGSLAFAMAMQDERLSASVPFYGLTDIDRPVRVPVLGHFGTEDRWPVSQLEEVARVVQADQPASRIHIYRGAPHAFFNDTGPSYRPREAGLAWERTLDFLRQTLGPPL